MLHQPVLIEEILFTLREKSGVAKIFLDLTFGRGGHTRGLLSHFESMRGVALDQDADAIAYGRQSFKDEIASGRLTLLHGNFIQVESLLKSVNISNLFDFILLDAGISSPQLDEGARGFSFYHDGPLDMRMDQRQEINAAEIVNTWSSEELVELFRELGEIPRPRRVAEAIEKNRKQKNFSTTLELAHLIERVEGWSRKGHHPATRYFLALRLQVNRELPCLKEGLPICMRLLENKGRLAVIAFHSLEDRIVKEFFRGSQAKGLGVQVNKKVIKPSQEEISSNPRSRSAVLRVFEREIELK